MGKATLRAAVLVEMSGFDHSSPLKPTGEQGISGNSDRDEVEERSGMGAGNNVEWGNKGAWKLGYVAPANG
jgi:hypothetical protein